MILDLFFAPLWALSNVIAPQTQDVVSFGLQPYIFFLVAFLYLYWAMPVYPVSFNNKVVIGQEKIAKVSTNPLLLFKWYANIRQNSAGDYFNICWALDIANSPRPVARFGAKLRAGCHAWLSFKCFTTELTNYLSRFFVKRVIGASSASLPFIHAVVRTESTPAILEPRRDNFKLFITPFTSAGYTASGTSERFAFAVFVIAILRAKVMLVSFYLVLPAVNITAAIVAFYKYLIAHFISNEKRPVGLITMLSRQRVPSGALINNYTVIFSRYLDITNYSTYKRVCHAS